MIVENINNSGGKPRILVAPLDWGLGHATRCIPIIKFLIDQNADVILAAKGKTASLLRDEFPDIRILELKGYKIQYSRNKSLFTLAIFLQLPKIFSVIRYERKWLKKMITTEKIDAVISDNRFGLYHKNIPCTFITHQLAIKTGNMFLNKLVQKLNYQCINNFAECWIPDNKEEDNLGGELSHPATFPLSETNYIGIISRFRKSEILKKYDFLILISGPEPQRTSFENILLKAFEGTSYSIVVVRGLPGRRSVLPLNRTTAKVFNHLKASEINTLILESETIIARCGYSTIMDLVTLQKKAILIPTPGQAEQEYLAKYAMEKKMFYCIKQETFNLKIAEDLQTWQPCFSNIKTGINEDIISNWLKNIRH